MPNVVTQGFKSPLTNPGGSLWTGVLGKYGKFVDPTAYAIDSVANSFSSGNTRPVQAPKNTGVPTVSRTGVPNAAARSAGVANTSALRAALAGTSMPTSTRRTLNG